jgi:class 3 adenylate cyclase
VFTLLETVYHAFDEIAKRRRVFKVETIGDCYVAVTDYPIRERIMLSSWHASPVML